MWPARRLTRSFWVLLWVVVWPGGQAAQERGSSPVADLVLPALPAGRPQPEKLPPLPVIRADSIEVKVLVLNFDPILEAEDGRRLHEVMRWNDPRRLAVEFQRDVYKASHGTVRLRIVEWRDLDEYPVKADGFAYDDDAYLALVRDRSPGAHKPDLVDYPRLLHQAGVPDASEAGEIDEVWLFGGPYFGYYESIMVGPNSYWVNAPPLTRLEVKRRLIVMGFNYERCVGMMLENLGHRAESILGHTYRHGGAMPGLAWKDFVVHDQQAPGQAACGNVHFAPNAERDYDWGNRREVRSTCDDWYDFPELTGRGRLMSSTDWGRGDARGHHLWWFGHLPHAAGRSGRFLNNWWLYVFAFGDHPESR